MRYSGEHKEQTRQRVLEAAGESLRENGVEGLGVAAVMSKAGLTHGAFYAHFASKDALAAEATAQAAVTMRERFERRVAGRSPQDAFRAQIDHYLSPTHRDKPAAGCLLPALSSDAARAEPALRAAYTEVWDTFVGLMQRLVDGLGLTEPGIAHSMASEMVGALTLARAVGDDARSTEILEASHAALLRRAGLV